jgi:uncharacterized protein (TIGR02569 family)
MSQEPSSSVLDLFQIKEKPVFLPGGEGRTYKAGDVILKHLKNDSIEFANWSADLFDRIEESGFRVSRPIKASSGEWVTPDGWSAWTYMEGNHNYEGHIEESVSAIKSFHDAIKDFSPPKSFYKWDSPYVRADKYAWGEKPKIVHPQLEGVVEKLYAVRQPLDMPDQLIHGDLNPDNILLSHDSYPVIIDIAPYLRPSDFGIAVYAYWIGAYRYKPEDLDYFKNIPNFKQLLVRAGIRMLLIMSEFNKVTEMTRYERATEIVENFASNN